MIVKIVFLCDDSNVRSDRNTHDVTSHFLPLVPRFAVNMRKVQKLVTNDVTYPFLWCGRQRAQFYKPFNTIFSESRPCTEKPFSQSYSRFSLNLIL